MIKEVPLSLGERMRIRQSLKRLNESTATHRFPGDDERFGREGIDLIMKFANTKANANIICQKLAELKQGKQIWTYDIITAIPGGEKKAYPFGSLFDQVC